MTDPRLIDEEARLAALHRYAVLDTRREEAFDRITALVQAVLDVPISAVSLIDRDRQWFKSLAGLDGTETRRCQAFCAHTIRQRAPTQVPDARTDDRFRDNPLVVGDPHIGAYLGVPLTTPDGYNVGALCAVDTRPREFSEQQIKLLRDFAALVVEHLELRQVAEQDHLTGALTRRAFLALAEKEIARFRRYGRGAALVLIDVDLFKSVNDSFGHPAGDVVLQAIGRTCGEALRPNDHFGRLGGEEFALLLTEVGPEDALATAERFRERIAALEIDAVQGRRITASFGIAPIHDGLTSAADWAAEADVLLYAAKRGGRNRCLMAVRGEAAVAA